MHPVAPALGEVPASQFWHVEPDAEYCPLGQSVQIEAPVVEDLPAGQSEQGVLSFVVLIFPTVMCVCGCDGGKSGWGKYCLV